MKILLQDKMKAQFWFTPTEKQRYNSISDMVDLYLQGDVKSAKKLCDIAYAEVFSKYKSAQSQEKEKYRITLTRLLAFDGSKILRKLFQE